MKYTGVAPYLWPAGDGGLVARDRVVAVARWESAPIRRLVRSARQESRLIDLTFGRACQWVIFLDSGHVALGSDPVPVGSLDTYEGEFAPKGDRYE